MENEKKFNPAEHLEPIKGGKEYLMVMWRLVWFRQDHPDWRIHTEEKEHVWGEHASFYCAISDPKTETIYSEAHGSENIRDFKDYYEKAETKAVGRALAYLGYGTQFAPELDEEERIVDSPVKKSSAKSKEEKPAPATVPAPQLTNGEQKEVKCRCSACNAPIYEATDGRKYKYADGSYKIFCQECIKKGIHKL